MTSASSLFQQSAAGLVVVSFIWLGTGAFGATDVPAEPLSNDIQRQSPAAPGATYNYGYTVQINATGDHKQAEESRTGDAVVGKYQVLEPDGTLLIVTYTAGEGGYRPKITRMKDFAPPPAAITSPEEHATRSGRFSKMRERQMANRAIIDRLLLARDRRARRPQQQPLKQEQRSPSADGTVL